MEAEMARRFHELTATSSAELCKAFNEYLRQLTDVVDLKWDEYVRLLSPRDRRQDAFRLKILRALDRKDELLDIFLQGNVLVNRTLLRDREFIGCLANATAHYLVDVICPAISHVSKRKLLYELSFVAEGPYYEAVLEKYGAKMARLVLATCRGELPPGAVLDDRQLGHLHKKCPELCAKYFEAEDISRYHGFARYLCLNDVHLFRKLRRSSMLYGKRMFLNFLKHYKEDVVENPVDFVPRRHKFVYKHVTPEEYFAYFKGFITRYPSEIDDFLKECTQSVPLKARGEVTAGLLHSLYGIDIWSTTAFVDAEFLKLLPLAERLKFADLNDEHVEVNSTDVSVPVLKSELENAGYKDERLSLCSKLLDTCIINKDFAALLEVLRYFDEKPVECDDLERGLTSLALNHPLENLGAEHWAYLHRFLPKLDNLFGFIKDLLWEKSIDYFCLNDLDFKPSLTSYTKERGYEVYYANITEKHQKRCILAFPELISDIYTGETEQARARLEFLEWAARYNQRHRKDRIDLYAYPDYILADLPATIKYTSFVRESLTRVPTAPEELTIYHRILQQVLDSARFDDFFNRFQPSDLLQLYNRRPDVFDACSFETFFRRGGEPNLLRALATTPHLNANLTRLSTSILDDPDSNDGAITSALAFLSYDPSFDLLAQLKRLLPGKSVETQKRMIACFKHSSRPWTNVDGLVELCNSGYLESADSALQHALLHTPEKLLVEPVPALRVGRERRHDDDEPPLDDNDGERRGNYSSRIEDVDRSDKLML